MLIRIVRSLPAEVHFRIYLKLMFVSASSHTVILPQMFEHVIIIIQLKDHVPLPCYEINCGLLLQYSNIILR